MFHHSTSIPSTHPLNNILASTAYMRIKRGVIERRPQDEGGSRRDEDQRRRIEWPDDSKTKRGGEERREERRGERLGLRLVENWVGASG
eukprot:scaffold1658_cov104-Skeletonema_dohrnii-CCMP3373.AAC.6